MMQFSGLSAFLSGLDFTVVDWLHTNIIPYSIPILQFISSTTTIVSISIALSILVFYFVKRSRSILKKFFALAIVLILVAIISQGLKSLIIRDRPFESHPVIEKLSDAGGSSFPSGHTMEAFAVAAALSILFSGKKIVIPIYAWAMLVAYSRIALGVHYPSDVLGGIIIGSMIGWIIPWVFRRFFPAE
jgi:membrane-associated phospholipid phosphatase